MIFDDLKKFHSKPYEINAIDSLADPSQYSGMEELKEIPFEYQLILIPSFEPYRTWTVYKNENGKRIIRRISWHRGEDFRAGGIAGPTTYGADGWLSKEEGDALLASLSKITLPAFRLPIGAGIDGVSFGIRMATFFCRTELSWWGNPPEGWEDLASWYEKAIETLDGALPARTPEQ